MKKVGVIGAGSWGTVLSSLCSLKSSKVMLWSRRKEVCDEINKKRENSTYLPGLKLPKNIFCTTDIGEIFSGCELVFSAVPAQSTREVMRQASAYVEGHHIIVSVSKGIEIETSKRMIEIIKEETCCKKVAALSGPNLAKEVAMGTPSAAVCASNIESVQDKVKESLESNFFKIYRSTDVVGVELGGAMKNIFAIAAGILDGAGFGANTKAYLISRSVAEMSRFGANFSAKTITFLGLSGLGDLIATSSSKLSRNRTFGEKIAKGNDPETLIKRSKEVIEGYFTTYAIYKIAELKGIYMPITEAIFRILYRKENIENVIEDLLQLKAEYEF